jgi:hypothetical protein
MRSAAAQQICSALGDLWCSSELAQHLAQCRFGVFGASQPELLQRRHETIAQIESMYLRDKSQPGLEIRKPSPPTSSIASPIFLATWSGVPISSGPRLARCRTSWRSVFNPGANVHVDNFNYY